MIKGTTDPNVITSNNVLASNSLFEIAKQAAKPLPYQNLTEAQAIEVAEIYFKSSIEIAIASLQSGLAYAKRTNHLKLIDLIEKDIATYCDMFNKRELKTFNTAFKAIPFTEKEV